MSGKFERFRESSKKVLKDAQKQLTDKKPKSSLGRATKWGGISGIFLIRMLRAGLLSNSIIKEIEKSFFDWADNQNSKTSRNTLAEFFKNNPRFASYITYYLIASGAIYSGVKGIEFVSDKYDKSQDNIRKEQVVDVDAFENMAEETREWGIFPDVRRGEASGRGHYLDDRARKGGAGPHEGIDLAYGLGQNIVAEVDGVYKGMINGGGKIPGKNTISIQLADGSSSRYLYALADKNLKVGDKVKKGQVIGILNPMFTEKYGKNVPPHIHFAVKKNDTFIDPTDYLVANRPGLDKEFYYSKKFRHIAKFLWGKKAIGLIVRMTDEKTFDVDHKLMRDAVLSYEKSLGKFQENVEIVSGYINPNGSFESFVAQVQPLEAAIFSVIVYMEEFSEAGFNDAGSGTALSGVKDFYTDRFSKKSSRIEIGKTVQGVTKDGKISTTEKDLNYTYVMNHMYNVAFQQIYDKINVPISYEWTVALSDFIYNIGYLPNSVSGLINQGNFHDAMLKMSEYRYTEGMLSMSLLKRRSIEIAIIQGDIKIKDFLNMQSGSYNSILRTNGFFKGNPVKGKPLKYEYSQVFRDTIRTYHASAADIKKKYQRESVILAKVSDIVPNDVKKQILETESGLPELSEDIIEAFSETNIEKKLVTPTVVLSDDVVVKANKLSEKTMKAYKSFKDFDENKDNNIIPNWTGLDNTVLKSKIKKVEELAKQTLGLNPNDWNAKAAMVSVHLYNKDFEKATALARQVVNNSDIDDNWLYANVLLDAAKSYEAQGFPYRAFTNYFFAQGRMPEWNLEQKIQDMKDLSEKVPDVLTEVADLRAGGNVDSALVKIQEFVFAPDIEKYAPMHKISGYVVMGEIHVSKKNWKDAADNYKYAFETSLNPDYAIAAAENYLKAGNAKQGIATAALICFGKDYYANNPTAKAKAWYITGRGREMLKEYDKALINYRKANALYNIYGEDVKKMQSRVNATKKPAQAKKTEKSSLAPKLLRNVQKMLDKKQYDDIVKATANIAGSGLNVKDRAKLWHYRAVALHSIAIKKNDKKLFKQAYNAYNEAFKMDSTLKDSKLKRDSLKSKISFNAKPLPGKTYDARHHFLTKDYLG